MGYNGQNPHPDFGGTVWFFGDDSLRLIKDNIESSFFVTCYSVADKSSGRILVSSNGCALFDSSYQKIPKLDSINFGEIWEVQCAESAGGYSVPQGGMLFHFEEDSTYVIIHQKMFQNPVPNVLVGIKRLLITRFSQNQKNQFKIFSKDSVLIDTMLQTGHLTAIKHINEDAWWIIQPGRYNDRYFILKLDSSGISLMRKRNLMHKTTSRRGGGGQASFSPNGKLYARFDLVEDGFLLMDFDRSTGELSNVRNIPISDEVDISGGLCFSPSSRFLYITAASVIYQFDLEANDIAASKTIVAEYDGFLDPFPTNFFLCNLGPDCRIYINSTNGVKSMHVIRYPDRKGLACRVAQHAIKLPTYNAASMPNFPHYRVDEPWPCDSTIGVRLVTSSYVPKQMVEFEVYPNPARDVLNLEYDLRGLKKLTFEVYNIHGELILTREVTYRNFRQELDISDWVSGVYSWRLYNDEGAFTSGKVVKE